MFTAISSSDMKIALEDFANLVKDKTYRKFPYEKWKEFCTKFKGKCIELELFGDDIEITSNDKQMMVLDIYDDSLGTYLYDEFLAEFDIHDSYYTSDGVYHDPHAFGRDIAKVRCEIAHSEVNKNGTKIDPEVLAKAGVPVINIENPTIVTQSTSSKCYPVKNYKLHDLDAATHNMDASLKEPIDTIIKKENKTMKGFNFDFGPCTNDNIRMSMYGLAVQNNAGIWVSYNNGQIVDVDVFNFDGRQYMFKMPVAIKDIKVGDIVIHNRVPMFVTSTEGGSISAVDVRAGEAKTIIPTTNMFGFNFVTKIVSMFDAFTGAPTADQPFGNMLPFIMLGDNKDIDPMMMFMMMNQGNGAFDMSNPMMLYFMFGKEGMKGNDMLPFMMMMNMQGANGKHTCNCGGHNND